MICAPTPAVVQVNTVCQWLQKPAFDEDFTITGFSTDTRTITAGSCFIALKGENFNGNRYAQAAVAQGAVICILSEMPETPLSVPYLLVEDCVKAYGQIATGYLQMLKANGVKVIGITGSSGKTTVKDMTAHVLAKGFDVYCTEGNHNNHIGLPYTILHTPMEARLVILEMGMNHKGEIAYLTGIAKPDMAVIANVGTAHIGNLGSQQAIFAAKMEITEGMDPEHSVLMLPAEDAYLATVGQRDVLPCALRYSSRTGASFAGLHASDINQTAEETRFTVTYGDETATVTLPMTGIHNVSNSLLAIDVALACGMSLQTAAAALGDFVPGAMRSERITMGNLTIVQDYYNANPEAMRASLAALQTMAQGAKRIAVLGNMNELGAYAADAHHALGALVRESADAAYFCGVNCFDFAAGYGDGCHAYPEQSALIAQLCADLQGDDVKAVMLIKGSRGMQMENVFAAIAKEFGCTECPSGCVRREHS
ncbi:MAG: UDP-N-acetylmuramoyl-tripeptide--D-alanyl-D-alanine ligase [Oscillospiraceae bacterium]|nr:UDP-N-acetylmuramoyl-tripeptide--D-alanyl-D-alanine ligase [Oscillospiraceae bacterium]